MMLKALNCRNESEYMYNIITYINDLQLSVGESKRTNCPECGGYKTFTVTNTMGDVVWNCYKLTCRIRGGTKVRLSGDDIRATLSGVPKVNNQPFTLPTYVVPHRDNPDMKSWCDTWGLDADELGLLYDVKENRVVFPVIHDGVMVDATGRTLSNSYIKWKRYGNNGLPYTCGNGNVAVVVEDCVSAAVVGYGVFVGVAVLGTSLSETHKQYLSQFSTAIVALDPDALVKTMAFAKDLRSYVDTVRVLRLTDDLKYRNETDIQNLTSI